MDKIVYGVILNSQFPHFGPRAINDINGKIIPFDQDFYILDSFGLSTIPSFIGSL